METVKNMSFIDTLLPIVMIVFVIATGVVLLNLHFQKNLSQQKLNHKVLEIEYRDSLLRTTIQIQEEERKRIAQDIHDELGAVLSIMRMHLIMLAQKGIIEQPDIAESINHIRNLSEKAMSSVRNISHKLMPPELAAFGLVQTIEAMIVPLNQPGKMEVLFAAPENLPGIPWDTELCLYRVMMELINNTLKHAQASRINISLICEHEGLLCDYEDNGIGLKKDRSSGLGHKNIEARLSALGGSFEMGNKADAGFFIKIRLPLTSSTTYKA